MKWILLLATPFILDACTILSPHPANNSEVLEVVKDSLEMHYIFNDSIDCILKHPSYIKMYKMASLVRDTIDTVNKDSLFNYPIDKQFGKLSREDETLLHFVINDQQQYRSDYAPIRQPFNPDFALEFVYKKQIAFYFVSFGTGEVAVADKTGLFKFFLMRDANIVDRWYQHILNKKSINKK